MLNLEKMIEIVNVLLEKEIEGWDKLGLAMLRDLGLLGE